MWSDVHPQVHFYFSKKEGHWPLGLAAQPKHFASDQLFGLANRGNTCYMNSVLQCLLAAWPLQQYFLLNLHKRELNVDNPIGSADAAVGQAVAHFSRTYWAASPRSALTPKSIITAVARCRPADFGGWAQQDAHEFLSYLLDMVHEDFNRVRRKPAVVEPDSDERPHAAQADDAWARFLLRNNSVVSDYFLGQTRSTLTCDVCGRESIRFEPFSSLGVRVVPQSGPLEFFFLRRRSTPGDTSACNPATAGSGYEAVEVQTLRNKFSVYRDSRMTIGALRARIAEVVGMSDPRRLLLARSFRGQLVAVFDDLAEPSWHMCFNQGVDDIAVYEMDRPLAGGDAEVQPATADAPADAGPAAAGAAVAGAPAKAGTAGAAGAAGLDDLQDPFDPASTAAERQACFEGALAALQERGHPHTAAELRARQLMVQVTLVRSNDHYFDDREPFERLKHLGLPVLVTGPAWMSQRSFRRRVFEAMQPGVASGTGLGELCIRSYGLSWNAQRPGTDVGEDAVLPVIEALAPLDVSKVSRRGGLCDAASGLPPLRVSAALWIGISTRDAMWFRADRYDATFEDKSVAKEKEAHRLRRHKDTSVDLDFCLDSKPERLQGTNMVRCARCERDAEMRKHVSLWRVPDVFVVHLKRFGTGPMSYFNYKMQDRIQYPRVIDMASHIPPEAWPANGIEAQPPAAAAPAAAAGTPAAAGSATPAVAAAAGGAGAGVGLGGAGPTARLLPFDLFGVVHHHGELNGGHYVADANRLIGRRGRVDSVASRAWLRCNDAHVAAVPEDQVLGRPSAYMLFYRRRTLRTDPAGPLDQAEAWLQQVGAAAHGAVVAAEPVAAEAGAAAEPLPPPAATQPAEDDGGGWGSDDADVAMGGTFDGY